MLVLRRGLEEKILIGPEIVITVVGLPYGQKKGDVAIGIDAPREIPILRGELSPHPMAEAHLPLADPEVPPR